MNTYNRQNKIMEANKMSNTITYNDKMAFHPGYYLEELLEESRLTLEDFAKRLGITNEDLSLLISGEQSLSIDMASKLSCLIGTSAEYWLNLQHSFDIITAEFASNQELRND